MNCLLKLFVSIIIMLTDIPIYAAEVCDYYVNGVDRLKPEETLSFFKGKIDYSKAYVKVPFLEELQSGIYIHIRHDVAIYAYISKYSDKVQIYREPSLARSGIDRFTPCIDKHVKANMTHFLSTCLHEKKVSSQSIFNQLASFMREKYEEVKHYCNCEDVFYATIIYVMEDGSVRLKEFNSPTCLDKSFDVDPVVLEWRTVDSLVRELVEPFDDRCDWRNLVPDSQKFSDEKYRKKHWSLILSEKDCPAL